MQKVLVLSSLGRHFRYFGQYDYKVLKNLGYEVHIAANFKVKEYDNFIEDGVIRHQIDFERMPYSLKNIRAFIQLKRLFKKNNYKIVHCQSPTAGFVTRLAFLSFRSKENKIIYTAHGFHFYKGAPILYWIIFYPIEKFLSKITDILITINDEDYSFSLKKFKSKTFKIPGVGINLSKFSNVDEKQSNTLRNELGINKNDFVMIFVGELNKNKNQILLIKVVEKLINRGFDSIKLVLVGEGSNMLSNKKYVYEHNLNKNVLFLGQRNDVPLLFTIANVSLSSSLREGLPVNVMEAMASGLPLIVTKCRGNIDLVQDGVNGFVVENNDPDTFAEAVIKLYNDRDLQKSMGQNSYEKIQNYSIEIVQKVMADIYSSIF